jgi:hypothetical protein
MNRINRNFLVAFLLVVVNFVFLPVYAMGQNSKDSAAHVITQSPALRDGQHDFDFEIGTWKTHLKRLTNPLSGAAAKWVEYDGTTIVRKVWNGKANLVELVADGPAGHFEGLNLRLYNPQSHQWSLNFANAKSGTMSQPTVGDFRNGIGEFYDHEDFNGKMVFVRFIINKLSNDSIRFEQSFSEDGGKNWELNWIATDQRVKE